MNDSLAAVDVAPTGGAPEQPHPEEALLSIQKLRLSIDTARGKLEILHDVTFDLARGETLGIVGESGSGKSMTVNAILGLLPRGAQIVGGSVAFSGTEMSSLDERTKRGLRGSRIGTILQDPTASLNPVLRVGQQVAEPLRVHRGASATDARAAAIDLLERVGISEAPRRVREYPHQFSGGMRQRIVGAAAISCGPDLLIADEPTTALDVTVQAAYLELLANLQAELGAGLLFISHDLGVVSRICNRVAVMYAGRVVETARTQDIFRSARHPYTMGLVSCLPSITEVDQRRLTPIPGNPPDPAAPQDGCPFVSRCPAAIERCGSTTPELREVAPGHQVACHRAEEMLQPQQLWPVLPHPGVRSRSSKPSDVLPTLELNDVSKAFTTRRNLLGAPSAKFHAVKAAQLQVFRGETVSIVGESGSGKTTCIRMLLGLEQATSGEVRFEGRDIARLDRKGRREFRRGVQAVFQDPYTSFNPRMSIAKTVAEPLVELSDRMSRREVDARVDDVLAQVGLEPRRVRDSFPHQLSGGQRQRVAIARALTTGPNCLVLDEPVSALDVSIRVQILNLLRDIQDETGVGILSISHDMGAVKYLGGRLVVMRRGQFVEEGETDKIFRRPQHEYTQKLLADAAAGPTHEV